MTNAVNTVNALLRRTAANAGCTPEEAHTAAAVALKLAYEHSLGGHTIARCLNAVSRTSARRKRAA